MPAATARPGGRISVTASSPTGRARLTVADEGGGLRPRTEEHVFERFWRGGSEGNGSGLGLAIVRATAERHGGRAYVEGGAFTIELPAFRKASDSVGTPSGEDLEKGPP